MPTNLIDDNTQFPTPIAVPAAGEPRTSASIQSPLQQFANRTANLKARVDALTSANQTGGVRQLQRASNLAAMTAIASLADGDMCLVDGVGLYEYVFASASSLVTNAVVAANGGVGRWLVLSPGLGLYNAPNGVAQADATGRTAIGASRYGIVAMGGVTPAPFSTSSTTFVDVTACSFTLVGLKIGDIIKVDHAVTFNLSATTSANTQSIVVQPTLGNAVVGQMSWSNNAAVAGSLPAGSTTTFVVAENGTHTIKMTALSGTGAAVTLQVPCLNAIAVRP